MLQFSIFQIGLSVQARLLKLLGHGSLSDSGETYRPLLRKIYLNAYHKIHSFGFYIHILRTMLQIVLQRKLIMLKYRFQNIKK